ncbi:MAG TPA: TetR/AcrR family transcriptional regulator [Solirubrobacterales bacterium]|nr:TetR/AcrR family transcriptional regulator [Solirubrobacterales bacterium]
MQTPWGDSTDLRADRLSPGRGSSPSAVLDSQRRRLFTALVARVAEHGYAATRVTDLCADSGVSSRSFYAIFPDKEACLCAALDVLLRKTVAFALDGLEAEATDEGTAVAIDRLMGLVVAQPAAARLCLVDGYAAGERSRQIIDAAMAEAESRLLAGLRRSPRWESLPLEFARAALGAIVEVVRLRLIAGDYEALPDLGRELLGFLGRYESPTRPLRSAPRPPDPRPEETEGLDHAERALRAFEALLAESDLRKVTMDKVARRAGMSVRTLYANFADFDQLLLASIDSATAILMAGAVPAARRHADRGDALRAAIATTFNVLAARPNLAHLLLVGVYEAGGTAITRREAGLAPLRSLLLGAYAPRPWTLPGAALGVVTGAVLFLARHRLLTEGAAALPGLSPVLTYLALFPVLGSEEATRAAEGRGYRRRPPPTRSLIDPSVDFATYRVAVALGQGSATAAQISEAAAMALPGVEAALADLDAAGLLETDGEEDGAPAFRMGWIFGLEEWARRPRSEREEMSKLIWEVCQEEVERAFASYTFDARVERDLARLALWLDESGFAEMSERLHEALEECMRIEAQAVERIRQGADAFPARALLALFEMPGPEWVGPAEEPVGP